MMSVLFALLSAGVKWLSGRFTPNPERELGRAEVENEALKKENATLAEALRLSDRIGDPEDDDRVRQLLNGRPR